MCTACQNAVNGMKRRKKTKTVTRRRARVGALNSKDLGGAATGVVLPLIVGGVVGRYMPQILSKVSPTAGKYGNYASIVAGLALGATQKGMLQMVGFGLAAGGGVAVANDLIDGQSVTGLGLLPPGQASSWIAGFPANGTTQQVMNEPVVVQQL